MLFAPKHKILRLLDPDGGGNAGSSGEGEGQDKENKAKSQNQAPTYTQEQLNEMFADRAKRGGEAAIADLLKKLNVDSIDSLTALFTQGKKLIDGQKTETEKLQASLEEANKKLEQLAQEKATALAQATEKLMRAAVTAEAMTQGFRAEAINDVWLVVDRSKVTEKDGEFAGVKEAVEAVAKAKPFWLGTTKDTPGRGTPRDDKQKPKGQSENNHSEPAPTVLRL